MLQAMNTGHDGSLTTIHANSPRDALMRLETMVAMANLEIPHEFLRRYVSSAINIIIHIARLADGTRKVTSLQEITGMEGNMITLQEIFSFQQTGIDGEGRVRGRFRIHGVRPKFMEKFKVVGIDVSSALFDPNRSMKL
jgi:pilus assembly protein CpaF